jgi:hypothetical protein
MTPPLWGAPRDAYLLTAAMADNAGHAGAFAPGDGVTAEWAGHDETTQQDILAALGAQTRLALKILRDELGVEIEMDWDSASHAACAAALAAARQLIKSKPGARAMPECARCRQAMAKAMCSLQIQAYFRLGFTPLMIAAMCRQSANETAMFPRH